MKAQFHLVMAGVVITCVCILTGCGGGGGGGGGNGGGGTAPTAPSNIGSTAKTTTTIDLGWQDNSSDETGFLLQRRTSSTDWTQVKSLASNTQAYTDTGLTASTTYYYRIQARNGSGSSDWATSAAIKTADANTGSVTGSVVNLVGGAGIGGVTVKLGTAATTTTAADGSYSFSGITPNTYAITVSHADYFYVGASVTVTVKKGETAAVAAIKMSEAGQGPPAPPF